jgi:adenylyltransferase/sulfurtransferase
VSKVFSARAAALRLNSGISVVPHECRLDAANAVALVAAYDIVVDCSDNQETRYLLNDVCVLAGGGGGTGGGGGDGGAGSDGGAGGGGGGGGHAGGGVRGRTPLVSGSAVGMEGQVTVYNFGDASPCYRCMHPVPQPAGTQARCSDNGVLGPVPGVIGCLQAMEAIKVAANRGEPAAAAAAAAAAQGDGSGGGGGGSSSVGAKRKQRCFDGGLSGAVLSGRQAYYDASDGSWRMMKLRPRDVAGCAVCGRDASIRSAADSVASLSVQGGCAPCEGTAAAAGGAGAAAQGLLPQIDCAAYNAFVHSRAGAGSDGDGGDGGGGGDGGVEAELAPHILLDVREPVQYEICSLAHAVNVPLRALLEPGGRGLARVLEMEAGGARPVFVICRRGVDSAIATTLLIKHGVRTATNVAGGLREWARTVDSSFPAYE